MAKFCGIIGFAETKETADDFWKDVIVERKYFGDQTRNFSQRRNSGNVNDDIDVSNTISIIADPYANRNLHAIRYVVFMGTKWKVTGVEVQYPRLILTIGGVYNA